MSEENKTEEQVGVSQEEYDKAQQMIKQERGNAVRAREEVEAYKGELSRMDNEIATLRASMEAKASAANVDVDDLDSSLADPAVVKSLRKTQNELKQLTEKFLLAQHKITKYEDNMNYEHAVSEQQRTVENILIECDDEYGSKYRNAAVDLADKLVDEGTEKKPKDVFGGMRLMKKCYKQVIQEAEAKAKEEEKVKVETDKGKGGFSFSENEDYEEGSLKDVLAGMKKRAKKNS
jgi:hypothetical protein